MKQEICGFSKTNLLSAGCSIYVFTAHFVIQLVNLIILIKKSWNSGIKSSGTLASASR